MLLKASLRMDGALRTAVATCGPHNQRDTAPQMYPITPQRIRSSFAIADNTNMIAECAIKGTVLHNGALVQVHMSS